LLLVFTGARFLVLATAPFLLLRDVGGFFGDSESLEEEYEEEWLEHEQL
jgi:hypothetical protein